MTQTEEILFSIAVEAARAEASDRAAIEHTRLRNLFREAARRSASQHRNARDELITEAVEAGVSAKLIAEAAHVSRQRIQQIYGKEWW